jgi:hypothetical protein
VQIDIERQQRKAQNRRELEEQIALQRRLEAMQAESAAAAVAAAAAAVKA